MEIGTENNGNKIQRLREDSEKEKENNVYWNNRVLIYSKHLETFEPKTPSEEVFFVELMYF